jgi:hypothetical protein
MLGIQELTFEEVPTIPFVRGYLIAIKPRDHVGLMNEQRRPQPCESVSTVQKVSSAGIASVPVRSTMFNTCAQVAVTPQLVRCSYRY